jgi:hypothetical protein
MPYVLMKVFEEAPRKFDAWMQLLTLGRLEGLRQEIASSMVGWRRARSRDRLRARDAGRDAVRARRQGGGH